MCSTNAYNGVGAFKDAAFKDERAVFLRASRAVHRAGAAGGGRHQFEDVKGKRFNVGNPGSGTRASLE